MSSYETKKDEAVNQHLDTVLEQKIARMVNDQQLPDNETNWHRGYVAACRDFAVFYNNELQRKVNGA